MTRNNLLSDTNFIKDGDFSFIKSSNLYHYSVPKRFLGLKYKQLFKYLVMMRSMIPLGIYRTERVSFKVLDPNYEESSGSEEEEDKDANILDQMFIDGLSSHQ